MPSGTKHATIYLVNHDIYGQTAHPTLTWSGHRTSLRVNGREMRIAWTFDDLLVSPLTRFVKINDARREGKNWIIEIETAAPGRHMIQIETSKRFSATVDGKTLPIRSD